MYKNCRNNRYLVNEYKNNGLSVDKKFLLEIFTELSKIEDGRMKHQYDNMLKKMEEEKEELPELTYEIELSYFEHSEYYKKKIHFVIKNYLK